MKIFLILVSSNNKFIEIPYYNGISTTEIINIVKNKY